MKKIRKNISKSMKVLLVGSVIASSISVTPPLAKASTVGEAPTLNTSVVNNAVQLDWGIKIRPEDILLETSFEGTDGLTPNFIQGDAVLNGGQGYETRLANTGNRSIVVEDTYTNGNEWWYPDTRSNFSRMLFPNIYVPKNVKLSITFMAKKDRADSKANIRPVLDGGKGNRTRPVNEVLNYDVPIVFEQDIAIGTQKFKVNDVTPFVNPKSRQYLATHEWNSPTVGKYHSYIKSADPVTNEIELYPDTTFRQAFNKGDAVPSFHWLVFRTTAKEIVSTEWEPYSFTINLSNNEDYDPLQYGIIPYFTNQTDSKLYIDDLQIGYATEVVVLRDNKQVYKGFESSFYDSNAKDTVSPNAPEGITINAVNGKTSLSWRAAEDNGKTYNYSIYGITRNGNTPTTTKSETVTSGVAGYSIVLDNNPNTVPDNVIETTGTTHTINQVMHGGYVHIATVDKAGNISEVKHLPAKTTVSSGQRPAPDLVASQLNNHARLDWGITIPQEDILYKMTFDNDGNIEPILVVGNGNTAGGQSISSDDSISGTQSLKIHNTVSKGNEWWYPQTASTRSRFSFPPSTLPEGMNLSLSFKARGTEIGDNGDSYFIFDGSLGSRTRPISEVYENVAPVYFAEDVSAGATTFKVNDVSQLVPNLSDIVVATHSWSSNSEVKGYSFIESVDIETNEIKLFDGSPLRQSYLSGQPLESFIWFSEYSDHKNIIGTDWKSYSMNIQMPVHEDFDPSNFPIQMSVSTYTPHTIYYDDLVIGYATEVEVIRNGQSIYSGFASEFNDTAATDKAAPNKPSNVIANVNGGKVEVSWNPATDNGTSYSYQAIGKGVNGNTSMSDEKTVDIESGINGYAIAYDEYPNTVPVNEVTTMTNSYTINEVKKDGYIHIAAIDQAGNISDVVHIKADDVIAPTISAEVITVNANTASVVIDASDAESLIDYITLPDGTNYNGILPHSFNVSANGKYTFKAVDKVGNYKELEVNVDVLDDVGPQMPSIIVGTLDWTQSTTVSLTPSSDLGKNGGIASGIASTQYRINNGEWVDYAAPFTLEEAGIHLIEGRSIDNLGNIGDITSATAKIDKSSPTIIINPISQGWTTEGQAQISYSDDSSGIVLDETYYAVTQSLDTPSNWIKANRDTENVVISDEGTWYIHAKTRDNAGNESSIVSDRILVQYLPSQLQNLTGTVTDSVATISFDLPSGHILTDGYKYEVSNLVTGKQFTLEYPQNTLTETGLEAGTSYTYLIKTSNHVGSVQDYVNVLTLPAEVTNLSFSPDGTNFDTVYATFDPVPSAYEYTIKAKDTNDNVVYEQTVTESVYQPITGLSAGTRYIVSVEAVNASGKGSSSIVNILTLPDAPTGFNMITVGEFYAELGWRHVDSALNYLLKRDGSVVMNDYIVLFKDTGLLSGQTYNYEIIAENETGLGAASSIQVLTLPSKVTSLTTTNPTKDSLLVTWGAVAGATSYEVLINGSWIEIAHTEYLATNLLPGTTHTFGVRAKNSSGAGATQSVTGITIPDKVNALSTVTIEQNSATLSWDNVDGATKYRIIANGDRYDITGNVIELKQLASGLEYVVTVEAGNEAGYGEASSLSFMTLTSPPSTFEVTDIKNDSMSLKWSAVTGATEYNIIVNGTIVATIADTQYELTGLEAGTSYSIEIQSIANGVLGGKITAVNKATQTETVSSPIASQTANSIHLTWDSVAGATEYVVTTQDGELYRGPSTEAIINGLKSNTTYTFNVYAINADGLASEPVVINVKTKLEVTESLDKGVVSQDSVTLHLPHVVDATEYIIYRDGVEIGRIIDGSTTFTDSGLEAGSTYIYTIAVKNDVGTSEVGNETIVTTLPPTVTKPAQPSAPSKDSISISWDAVKGATGYKIYDGNTLITITTETSITLTNLVAGKVYNDLTIVPFNENGDSVPFKVDDFITIPEIPGNAITSQASSDSVTLQLPNVQGADELVIYRDGVEIARVPNGTLSFTDKNLQADTLYQYNIVAVNASGSSAAEIITMKTDKAQQQGNGNNFIPAPNPPIPDSSLELGEKEEEKEQVDAPNNKDKESNQKGKVNFTDINNLANKNEIIYLAEKNIINGVSDTKFEPSRTISRAEFTAIVVRALGLEIPKTTNMVFKDIKGDEWYAGVINAAAKHNVVKGLTDGRFAPNNNITREEASIILANVLKMYELQGKEVQLNFNDYMEIAEWAESDVKYLLSLNMINGYADGTFKPKNNLKRAEAVSLIYRMLVDALNK